MKSHHTHATHHAARFILATAISALPLTASAIVSYTTPNVTTSTGAQTSYLGNTMFINHGLQGVGRISASTLDPFNETLGAASGLQITNWTGSNGSYNGTLNILPDRGYNSGAFYSAYAARIEQVNFSFTPYTGTTGIGGTTVAQKVAAQNQITMTSAVTGVRFTYDDPVSGTTKFTTGLDPGAGTATVFGKTVPYVINYTGAQSPSAVSNTTYSGINQLTLDSEALVLRPDGSGYIGDEYGANIYYFDTTKKIVGVITPPAAIQPHAPAGTLNFNSLGNPANGRRNNQGMEGVALSPDGSRLFALLQSAAVQDASNTANQTRVNTRLVVYNVSSNPTPGAPVEEYALQLPNYTGNGGGGAVNATAAQSEIVALDNNRFLVLSRDANGLGAAATNRSVYKSVLLVDLSVASPTNFAGTARDAEGGTIATVTGSGTTAVSNLQPGITPLSWTEAVNLLNSSQLNKFNLTLDGGGANQVSKLTLGEKWEGMSLVPANDPLNPFDYFLFVANDNDFMTSSGQMLGPDGTLVSYNAFNGYASQRIPGAVETLANENDLLFLAYRVTIAPVPEPGTALFGGLIALAAGLRRSRRRHMA